MCSLDSLEVEVKCTSFRVRSNCGVAGVGERAGLTATEAGHVVLVAAESLRFGVEFEFEGAKLLVDDLPYNLIRRHCE